MNRLVALMPTRGQVAALKAGMVDFRFLTWAALPITDRRWTAPMGAVALGFGLFIGVGLSPGLNFSNGTVPIALAPALATNQQAGGGPSGGGGSAGTPALGSPVANTAPPSSSPPTGPSAPPPSAPIASAPPPPPAPAPTTTTTSTDTTTPTTTPTEPDNTQVVLKGTVIHLDPGADSYALASGKGQLSAVHAKKLPEVGAKLAVPVRTLANGTYAEDGKVTDDGHADSATFQGLVTYVDPATGDYTVSRRGSSIYVRLDPDAGADPPTVGSLLTVGVDIAETHTAAGGPTEPTPTPTPTPTDPAPTMPEPTTTTPAPPTTTPAPRPAAARATPVVDLSPITLPDLPDGCGTRPKPPKAPDTTLIETSRESGSDFLGYSDFEGVVQGVCPDIGVLMLSADDAGEAGADLTFSVTDDAGLDLSALEPGDVIDASATIDEGTFDLALTGLSGEGGIDEADDSDLAQGDQAG